MNLISGHFAYSEVLAMIFIPVAIISFLTPFRKFRNFRPLALSIITVAPFFIVWDHFAVIYGTWEFNRAMVLNLFVFKLPLEEILFFIVVPFSTIIIMEILIPFSEKRFKIKYVYNIMILLSVIFIITGLFNLDKSYTSVVCFFASGSMIIAVASKAKIVERFTFWLYILISYIPFIIFDHIMVTLPIFVYGRGAIVGIRIFSIPIEEYLYVFTMLFSYGFAYDFWRKKLKIKFYYPPKNSFIGRYITRNTK